MTISDIAQRKISELLHFVVTGEKVEVGRSAVAYLNRLLPEIKKELGLDFDDFQVNLGVHSRDTADVVLFKRGKITRKLTVKTAVSANIQGAIRRMQREKRYEEDGLLMFGLYCVSGNKKDIVLGIILIPRMVLYNEPVSGIYNAILEKVIEKKAREKFDEISIVAMNESIILETAAGVLENRKAIEENRKSIEMLSKKVDDLREEVKSQVNDLRKEVRGQIDEIKQLIEKINNTLETTKERK